MSIPRACYRAALRLVPFSWRAAIERDLGDEGAQAGRGDWWRCAHAALLGARLRFATSTDVAAAELRYALRSLARARWFAAGAVITFALGIGANVAIFAAVDRMLFRSLPYRDPARLVLLRDCPPDGPQCNGAFPSAVAEQLSHSSSTIESIAVAAFSDVYRVIGDPPDGPRLLLVESSPNLLELLGVTPVIGRRLTPEEAASSGQFAWIAYDVWKTRFGGDPGVIGRQVWASTTRVPIIGVLPKDFLPPVWSGDISRWDGLVVDRDGWATIRPTGGIHVPIARLRAGVSAAAAQAEMNALALTLAADPSRKLRQTPAIRVDSVQSALFSRRRRDLLLVAIPAALVLALACGNLASLLMARSRDRQHQAAIRIALGASRRRVFGAVLLECAIVASVGAAIGLLSLGFVSRGLAAFIPPLFVRNAESPLSGRVLVFALAAVAVSCLVAGIAPARQLSRGDVRALIEQSTARGRRLRGARILLAAQAAFGCVLVLAAMTAVRNIVAVLNEDLGFNAAGLTLVSVTPLAAPANGQTPNALAFHERAAQLLNEMPGVVAAGGGDLTQATGGAPNMSLAPKIRVGARFQVTAGALPALGVRILAGRTISQTEVAARSPVAVLTKSAVSFLWPGTDPVSAVGRVWTPEGDTPREIVGVIADLRSGYADARPYLIAAFVPIGSAPTRYREILARTTSGVLLDSADAERRLSSQLGPVRVLTTLAANDMARPLLEPRFRAWLFAGLGLVAITLLGAGLFAIANYDVTDRRYEMGVRLALGAAPARLRWKMAVGSLMPVAIGLVAGLTPAYWGATLVQTYLYRVDAREPLGYLAVAAVTLAVALCAVWGPARRAAHTDPSIVLRAE